MIVVNTPGDWNHVYPPLLHAEWHGWTYTDTIFPFFLFIVGVSMAFSFGRRRAERRRDERLFLHTLRRAAIIFGIGLALNVLSFFLFHRQQVRIPGVLQRIGVCLLLRGGDLSPASGPAALLPAAAVLLALYWALMTFVPVPGLRRRAGSTSRATSRVRRRAPSSASTRGSTTRTGIRRARSRRSRRSRRRSSAIAAGRAAAVRAALAGEARGAHGAEARSPFRSVSSGASSFPINKNLWTSSYALAMAGLAAVVLALCLWIVDVRGWKDWSKPFEWLGHERDRALRPRDARDAPVARDQAARRTTGSGARSTARSTGRSSTTSPTRGSARSSSRSPFLACWIAVGGVLYRKRIFVKV